MSKIKTWMEKPFTRGDYTKMCVWSLGFTTVIYAATAVYIYKDQIIDKIQDKLECMKDY